MKIKRVKEIYKGSEVGLRLIKAKFGKKEIKKEIVLHKNSVGILPLVGKDKVVLVKQYRFPVKKELWEIPAGALEKNENPMRAAKRELKEETGLEAKKLLKIAEFYKSPGYNSEYMYLFKASQFKKGKQRLDYDELINRVKVFSLKEALKMIKNKKIVDAKTILAILLYLKECK